ncbi:MAG: hypothetical protein C0412_19835 [Flavobacterium sp.]|nr:hypothetical protein [Flavobacterium sp.]
MPVIRNKKPIEKAFVLWISQYPESYHPCDMDRFYKLAKTVCRYGRKAKHSQWLRKKIVNFEGHHLGEKDVEYYCDLFDKLIRFHRIPPVPLYEI